MRAAASSEATERAIELSARLGARLLIVLGHERCGAVGAAVKGGKLPTPGLQAMVDEITPSVEAVHGQLANTELSAARRVYRTW